MVTELPAAGTSAAASPAASPATSSPAPVVRLLGIRHHGPGSARSVVVALDELLPDVVLLEWPADCQAALSWIGDPDLSPPVAMLGYVVDQPHLALFSPLAEFSPEWQACAWAKHHGVEVHAIDLPLTNVLAEQPDGDELRLDERPLDPLAALAEAAGDGDPERWWDDVIEHRGDGAPAFESVAEAMSEMRGADPSSVFEARREAHMRQCLRRALADGYQRVAVVCGAWHTPALALPLGPAGADAARLRGLRRVKVGSCWVPWTHRRLATASGYAAGVRSPGWYSHLFAHPGPEGITRWFVDTARLLRQRDMLASPDEVIAAHRSATVLAALRGRPRPGLAEVLDATEAVLAGSAGIRLIDDELLVGDAIGAVPDTAPQAPLARDLAAQQRRLRLKPTATAATVELDLRTAAGRGRSVLLHRLAGLGVAWGSLQTGRGSSGTFRETWRLQWEPELTIRLIELAGHGTTVEAAAGHRLLERVGSVERLGEVVQILDRALLGDLAAVVQPCVDRLAALAAHDPDLGELIDAVSPLARALRYGDVRSTDATALTAMFDGLVVRVLAGLGNACRSLDDEAANAMAERISSMQAALALVDHVGRADSWPAVLGRVCEQSGVHGLVQGRSARLLHDGGTWPADRVQRRLSRGLSGGVSPAAGASFVEGFVAGSGTVLIHDAALLDVIDGWVSSLSPEAFLAAAPLLRRTFAAFEAAERRQLGSLLAGSLAPTVSGFGEAIDDERAAQAMITVRLMLGVPT